MMVISPPVVLSADEIDLIRHYRTMDLCEKSHYQDAMKWSAAQFPQAPSPRLRLVAGGATRSPVKAADLSRP